MTQYIDKSALAAEIDRRIKTNKECMLGLRNLDYYQGKVDALNDTLSFIDTLEVKGVDMEKEFDNYANGILACDVQFEPFTHLHKCAKHFFELGLKAQQRE